LNVFKDLDQPPHRRITTSTTLGIEPKAFHGVVPN
jgi:hypothetical protein